MSHSVRESGLRSFATRLGKGARSPHKTPWVLLILAALAVGVTGGVLDASLHQRIQARVASTLSIIQKGKLATVRVWAREQREVAAAFAQSQPVNEARSSVLGPELLPSQRLSAAASLAAYLDPVLRDFDVEAWLLVDERGKGVARQDTLALVDLPLSRLPGALEALRGEARVGAPFRLDDELREAGLRAASATMWVWAPVRDSKGEAWGLLGLRMDPEDDFVSLLQLGARDGSIESYAFDAQGRMVSKSRFESQLRELGLLQAGQSSTLNVTLRDPGGNLLTGFAPELPREQQPLTRMARAALAGDEGEDLKGYRDYRGVHVVGTWNWLPDMGIGIATELDETEAFGLLSPLRLGLWGLCGVLFVAALLAFSFSSRASALEREVQAASELGQYKLRRKLGEGGMGVVYEATHAMLARPAAVKLLRTANANEELIARFEREVRSTAELTHPNTIAVYDYGRSADGTFFYAMEYLDGIDLESLIAEHGAQPVARTLHILVQVLGSLAEAHEHGLIHRDVKPANIMLTHRGGIADFVKVLDFGLVRSLAPTQTKLTQENQMLGTPLYMAPESMTTPDDVDDRADVYAVGAVAYYMLSGEDAFAGNSHTEIISKHLSGTYRRLDDLPQLELPDAVVQLVHSCMAADRIQRPHSTAVLERLEQLAHAHPWPQREAKAWWQLHGSGARPDATTAAAPHISVAPTLMNRS